MVITGVKRNVLSFIFIIILACLSFSAVDAFADVIIDNGDTGTSSTGTWAVSGGTEPYGDNSLWARDGATYTWQFDSEPPGTYEVLKWWSAWPSRATDISVDINYTGGIETITINQQEGAGDWNSLGSYYFGSSGSVRITAAFGSSVSTCADAVWFRFVSDNAPPTAYIDSIIPNPAEPGQLIEFSGHGTDNEGTIDAYQWESSIDGPINNSDSFTTSTLSEGTHTISFRVQDNEGLWSQQVTQILIVGTIPTEITIDNRDPETSQTGTWSTSGASDPYGADSIWSRDGTTFTWHFSPPQTGDYEVSIWWTEWSSRSDSVPVTINYEGGSEPLSVNQQQNGGQWNSLGIFHFDVNSGGSVSITSQPGPSSTCADAVKFNFVQSNDPPTATIVSISPNPADVGQMVYFSGEGNDPDGSIIAYSWESNIAGELSVDPSFEIDSLSEGVHTITFKVQDNELEWSAPATETLTVGNPPNIPPTAIIDSITPNPANIGEMVTFTGHGEDSDGGIIAYEWESSIDGVLPDSNSDFYATSSLSEGTHTISFSVQDEDGVWSEPATEPLIIESIPTEIIIDNRDPETSQTGTWSVSGGADPYDADSVWSRDGTTFTWHFDPPQTGDYEVSIWWTEWSSRSDSVPVTINYEGGSEPLSVNQQQNGGQWNDQGSYFFEAGTTYDVTVTSQPASTSTCADAVRFIFVSASTYTITATAGANGAITPSRDVTVNEGGDQAFDIAPDTGYHVADVLVDGSSVGAVTSYTFTSVVAGHTIAASFEVDTVTTYTITATAGINGAITPSGDVTVNEGNDQAFDIAPDPGYQVDDVLVDGSSVGAVTSYTFTSVVADHTIDASFESSTSQTENIYVCDGYSKDSLFTPWCITKLQSIGAVQQGGVWVYTNNNKGITYYIHFVDNTEEMEFALKDEGSTIIYNGHANYGLAAFFATSAETAEQRIYDVLYVDDDRFLNLCTDMVSIKIDGMQNGQAYPNWTPYLKNGDLALMAYSADEGMPPYNYYLNYTIPGDPTTIYNVELDGELVERFPDSRVEAWDFTLSAGALPDPWANPEYFITNPGDEYNHCEYEGDWSMGGDCYYDDDAECLGYNYHYSAPGSGADIATWYFVVEVAGNYYVDASWESSPSNATNAKYTIYHSGGSTVVEADQTVNTATGWNRLGGEYYFDEGMNIVELNDNANGTVIADAVQLSPVGTPDDIIKSEFRARSPVSGAAPLTVEFDDRSYASEEITEWRWDFGDSSPPLVLDELPSWGDPPITHTYSSSGIYTVSLRVTDALGRLDTEIKEGFVVVGMDPPLHAEFTQTSRIITVGDSARFTDQSSGDITSWSWDFDNDGTEDSTDQNPRYTYEATGIYTVSLTVTGPGGSDTETEVDFAVVVMPTYYVDNSYIYKSHFTSRGGGDSTFGKVVLDVSSATIPKEELRYSRFFYASCNTCNYYMGSLGRGIFFCTTSEQQDYVAHHFLRDYLLGKSDDEILSHMNDMYETMGHSPIYRYYNFNLKPPSLR